MKLELQKNMIIPLLDLPGVQITGSSIKENLSDLESQFKTLKSLLETFKMDGVFPFMDLTIEAEALGLKINFPENDNPSVLEHPVKNREDFLQIKDNWHGITERMTLFIELMKRMNKEFDVLKGAYVIGPFSLTAELMGPTKAAENVLLKPEFIKEILEFSADLISEYAEEYFKAGADFVVVLEPTAVILSPEQYRSFSQYYFQMIYHKIKQKPLILHICGDTSHLLPVMAEADAVGYSLDSQVDFSEADKIINEQDIIIGNLDTTEVFLNGNKIIIDKSVKELCRKMQNRDNFILSSGCDIPLNTPHKNISLFMEKGRKYLQEFS